MSTTNTPIQWTDRTWSPVRGCSRVSPGCDRCYAMGQAHRFSGAGRPYEGLTTIRKGKVDWSGVARFVPLALEEPLHWRKPARIFVNSMSDLFHHSLSNEEIAAVFGVMAACPQHTFQVLTKRAERMREWFAWAEEHAEDADMSETELVLGYAADHLKGAFWSSRVVGIGPRWPLHQVWLGVSAEDQQRADERIPYLLATPAAVRFVSAEPLLGPIDFTRITWGNGDWCNAIRGNSYRGALDSERLDWVIVGGESGPGARICRAPWLREIVSQCREAGVPCFVKQLGAHPVDDNGKDDEWLLGLKDRKGGDPSEWPADLRVRQFPGATP